MGDVTALPGYKIPEAKGEPIFEVVELCKYLLGMAENGELRGLAAAYTIYDGTIVPIFGKKVARDAGTLGDLLLALGRLQRELEIEFDA